MCETHMTDEFTIRHFVTLVVRECKSFMHDDILVRSKKARPKTLQATEDYDQILKELDMENSTS